ncbi:small subunit processome component 20 homolog isoform X1 [Dendrobium catenatum]|uniref:small subunit processome component 20 homolog isoform X1 n=2 Tax=Dendrobium catenatum TaxID=906689 RepID=UPI0009F2EA37|nr:small subunit processome component 20 homolog isoform X1 [Dendrobium catenatum]
MATSQSQAVKCLNTSTNGRRFVFKTFSQRVEEIDIDVFRSLEHVGSEPKDGSSFFREALLYWRELNTAEDFISFYDEMMPLVQTLPQIILQKELIFSELVGRLQMGAKLSLEPILMLIVAFSRDVLEEFLPFLERFASSLTNLLSSGGDRDPEVLEQVFTAWSYIVMYLQKNLVKDVVNFLKITAQLRYYPKDYVQEFMAEVVSFLLRNAPLNQLKNGIRKIIMDVVKGSSAAKKLGAAALLWHVLSRTSSRLHSKARQVLLLLMEESVLSARDIPQGSEAVLDVVNSILHRFFEEIDHTEQKVVFECLFESIYCSIKKGCLAHLVQLLTLLTTAVRLSKGGKCFDGDKMIELIRLLMHSCIVSAEIINSRDCSSEAAVPVVSNKILQLVLCLLDMPQKSSYIYITMEIVPAFKLEHSSLLMFVKGLVHKDPEVVLACRTYIVSTIDEMIETSPDEVLVLILEFFERQSSNILDGIPRRTCKFFIETLNYWANLLSDISTINSVSDLSSKLAVLWGVIRCYPSFECTGGSPLLIRNLIGILDQLLEVNADSIAGVPMSVWQDLLGATLNSYHKLLLHESSGPSEAYIFLHMAKKHKSSPRILSAVAEYLETFLWSKDDAGVSQRMFAEVDVEDAQDSIRIFADNLSLPNKEIRISTLRIVSHYNFPVEPPTSEDRPLKKVKYEESDSAKVFECINVVDLLLSIEATPISVLTSRKVAVLISRLQMVVASGKLHDDYVPLIFNGVIGILHNRFSLLWDPALECLTTLIRRYSRIVWNQFVQHLEYYQLKSLSGNNAATKLNSETPQPKSIPSCYALTLVQCFNMYLEYEFDSTPCITVMALLLKTLQKISAIAESHSGQLIPLFLKFLGYTDVDKFSVESFSEYKCKRKEWRSVLKEWLSLLKLMHNSRSLYKSQLLKDVLMSRLLDEVDPDIQLNVIDCLLNWKDDYLIPYDQHLKNLIISRNIREELTTWAVSKESEYIQEEHRAQLIPVVVRLLAPKVRKIKTLALHKHAGMNIRRAILCFLAQLEVDDLHLFFSLLLKPLLWNHHGVNVLDGYSDGICSRFSGQWQSLIPLNCSITEAIANISLKRKYGFLYVLEDVLKTFDEIHIRPFLRPLMTFVVLILENCMSNIKNEVGRKICASEKCVAGDLEVDVAENSAHNFLVMSASGKQLKDLRSLCLKILSSALSKHDSHDFGCEFWDIFFNSVKPLIDNFKNEGSSSEKPSSLFSCFLVMSRSPVLVSFLNREANLVPAIFSILTVRTASDAIISSVLGFIENLLNLETDSDLENDSIKAVFYPHLEVLVKNFHELILSNEDSHRKSAIWPGKRELRIFKLIAKYVKSQSIALPFLDILLPFFKRKALDFDDCLEALHVMKGILQYLPVNVEKTSGKILKSIFPILAVAGVDVQLCVCDIIDSLALIDPSLAYLARLLRDLTAVSSMDIGEFDYDTRISAYEKINPELFSFLGVNHALLILSHCIYYMSSDELILRQCASKSLQAFVQFASSYLKTDAKNSYTHDAVCNQSSGPAVETSIETNWTKACILWIISDVLLKNMKEALTKEISIQKEWMTLLRDMIYNLHEVPALSTFRPLCSEDPEVDFFNNILHLQIHRRRRALMRFINVINAGNFTENIAVSIFVPLFLSMMFEVKDGKGEHIREACLDSLASISNKMQWESYRSFLMKCFREITVRPDKQKLLVRLICAILDKFHFFASKSCERDEVGSCDALCSGNPQGNAIVTLQDSTSVKAIPEIQSYLQKTVLPQIQKILTMDSEKVNVNISLAALKLLKLLPLDTMDSQLSSIVHHVCTFLKNRLESVRDEARSALAACAKELGLEYLHFIIKVMQSILKRGYEMHVLGYSLNFILSKILIGKSTGSLDYCLEELVSIAENDIFGDVAEEKEVEKIASKMKETRKSKSFETLKLISQSITFRTHAMKLLSPIHNHIEKHLTPKIKRKLEIILSHIASGIESNPSAQTAELFIFVYGLIEDNIAAELSYRKERSETAENETSSFDVIVKEKPLRKSACFLKNSYLITGFALEMLHNRLKNIKLDKNDQQLLSMLDPFVKQLGYCLNSKFESVLAATFRCLAPLFKLPLPSMDKESDKIKSLLLSIAQRSGDGSSSLALSCIKLLTMLLRNPRISISHGELHMIIRFPMFIDIQTNPSTLALSLLKTIFARKLVVHEIYDIILRVAELMVTSQSEPIRRKCSEILLQFLLEYQLSDKRLQQHMDFLLSNLSYEHPSGRESVLDMLHAILIKFPRSVIDSHVQTFFLHLVVSLANEQDQRVRSMVLTVLKELISRTSQQMLQPILEYTLSWYFGKKQYLWSPSAEVIGLLIEVWRGGLKRHIIGIMQTARNILKVSVDAVDIAELGVSKEPVVPCWKEAYYSLVMIEKMFLQFSELYFQSDFEEIWGLICKFLLHPHLGLRNISSRLVALYFTAVSEACKGDSEKMIQKNLFLINPSRLFAVAVSFLKQLEGQVIDDASGNMITQNLAFSICSLHSFAKHKSLTPLHKLWSMLAACEQSSYLDAFDLLGSRKAKRIFLLSTSVTAQSSTASENEDLQSLLVKPLLKRLGKIAMEKENFQMKIVFNCIRTISSQIGVEGSREYAIYIILPLYKACEGFAGKVVEDEIKQLAEEVRDGVRDILGVENFIQVYNRIRKNLKGKRDHRRTQQKLIAVMNPMLHAKRKLRVAAKHRAYKRRKFDAMKMRWKRT